MLRVKRYLQPMNYMPLSIPLAIAILLVAMGVITTSAGAVTVQQCADDFNALIAEIERNRQSAITKLNRQLNEVETDQQRDSLKFMLEQVWDDEERQRVTANMIRRDCEKAAKVNG